MRPIDADQIPNFEIDADMSCGKVRQRQKIRMALWQNAEQMPTLDVAPVVRCKDCLWRGREECAMFYRCDCGEQHTWETDNDFCSYGERKEPDNEQPNRNR